MPEAASRWPMFVFTAPMAQRLPGGRPSRKHVAQGRGLDGVAQPRAGALGLDELHLARRDLRPGVGLAEHLLLGGAAGGRHAVARSVLVDGAAADHGVDGVVVLQARPKAA